MHNILSLLDCFFSAQLLLKVNDQNNYMPFSFLLFFLFKWFRMIVYFNSLLKLIFKIAFSLYCALYTVPCTCILYLYFVPCTLLVVPCTMDFVPCMLYWVQSTLVITRSLRLVKLPHYNRNIVIRGQKNKETQSRNEIQDFRMYSL